MLIGYVCIQLKKNKKKTLKDHQMQDGKYDCYAITEKSTEPEQKEREVAEMWS